MFIQYHELKASAIVPFCGVNLAFSTASLEKWELLAESLLKHGMTHNVIKVVESDFGTRYNIDGIIETPDGRNPNVRTVWIIGEQTAIPRLITAYPQ